MTTHTTQREADERAQKALEAITDRLALTYRICCGTAPKQSVGELLDATINMPEWAIVRAAIDQSARQASPECNGCDPAEGFCRACRDAERQSASTRAAPEAPTQQAGAAVEAEYNDYLEWCVAQDRMPMKFRTFKSFGFTARDLSAATTASASEKCGCTRCLDESGETVDFFGFKVPVSGTRMVLCAICGNKRCPHATDHRHACTDSNDPGQPGSSYSGHAALAATEKGPTA